MDSFTNSFRSSTLVEMSLPFWSMCQRERHSVWLFSVTINVFLGKPIRHRELRDEAQLEKEKKTQSPSMPPSHPKQHKASGETSCSVIRRKLFSLTFVLKDIRGPHPFDHFVVLGTCPHSLCQRPRQEQHPRRYLVYPHIQFVKCLMNGSQMDDANLHVLTLPEV